MKDSPKSEKFLWVGNDLAIDFANTEIAQDGRKVDLLETPGDLLDWLRDSGIVESQSIRDIQRTFSRTQLEQALTCAREYRCTLKTALQHVNQRGSLYKDRDAIAATNRLLDEPRSTFALSATEPRIQLRQNWLFAKPDDLSRPIAFAFARLLTAEDLSRLRKCQNAECVLFFLDTSKSNTRAWCSMNICGNKLRVAAFRRRHEASSGT